MGRQISILKETDDDGLPTLPFAAHEDLTCCDDVGIRRRAYYPVAAKVLPILIEIPSRVLLIFPVWNGVIMARSKSRRVELSEQDRELLLGITRTGAHPAQEVRRARILLELDENADENGAVPSHEAVPARAGVRAGPSSARTRL